MGIRRAFVESIGNGAYDGLTMLDISRVGRGTGPVANNRIFSALKAISTKDIMTGGDGNWNLREDFFSCYFDWIRGSTVSPVEGLDKFSVRYFVNGVTEAYDIFFAQNKGRRFRVFKGEYPYVQLSVPDWVYIEDDDIKAGDAVAFTTPFYLDGGVPRNFEALLDRCRDLGVPVFVDAAYFGTCYGVSFDYSHPAISMLGFSLSKTYSIQSYRAGMLLMREKLGNFEEIQVASGYFNRVGAFVGLSLMQKFSADFMPLTYRMAQRDVAYRLGLLPSHSIMLANVRDDDRRFDEILADDRFEKVTLPHGVLRRACISAYLSDGDPLPKKVIKRILGRA